jgi:hypothetical protein
MCSPSLKFPLIFVNKAVSVPGGVTKVALADNIFQNGSPDAVALVDNNGVYVDAVVYEGVKFQQKYF